VDVLLGRVRRWVPEDGEIILEWEPQEAPRRTGIVDIEQERRSTDVRGINILQRETELAGAQ
jgi:hypothetical protein